jgi:glycosyltransferase involved in cell wall biosynthesis
MQEEGNGASVATATGVQHAEGTDGRGSLLLDLPVPFRRIGGVLHVDVPADVGILCWLDNFERVTVCAPCVPEAHVDPTASWVPADELLRRGGLTLHALPWGYHPRDHLRHRTQVRDLYRGLIASHDFLCFANLGWAGAWGNIAADEASRMRRPYAVWLDWVLHEMRPAAAGGIARRCASAIRDGLEKRSSLRAVRRAALGLFHGRTVYDAYAPISRNPHVVHNVHLGRQDMIAAADLAARLTRPGVRARIGYVGRAHERKGPLQWISAMERLARCHPGGFEAIWLGDGPLLEECRAEVVRRGLADVVFFPGAERDRAKVLEFFRSLDAFAFCHLTQESPRCLIEALMSGVPLVGYDSAYARDLVAEAGGGEFVPVGDVEGLAARLADLMSDGAAREAASMRAVASGERFSVDAVFAHRSELIKRHLVTDAAAGMALGRGGSFERVGN